MEILGNFGINPILLVAQIVNFLIVFYIVKRFALQPIMTLLRNREKTIKDGLQQAEEARLMLEQAEEKEREILQIAQKEAKAMLAEAKKQRGELLEQAQEDTRKQTERMLEEARGQISFETAQAEKRLTAHISELAITMIEKSAKELFTEKEQSDVMERALKNLKKKVD
jgi:F-type H+-transporting ATPase subunit b